jgi:hypothetical protein
MHRHVFERKEIRAVTPFQRCSPSRPRDKASAHRTAEGRGVLPTQPEFCCGGRHPRSIHTDGGRRVHISTNKNKIGLRWPFREEEAYDATSAYPLALAKPSDPGPSCHGVHRHVQGTPATSDQKPAPRPPQGAQRSKPTGFVPGSSPNWQVGDSRPAPDSSFPSANASLCGRRWCRGVADTLHGGYASNGEGAPWHAAPKRAQDSSCRSCLSGLV